MLRVTFMALGLVVGLAAGANGEDGAPSSRTADARRAFLDTQSLLQRQFSVSRDTVGGMQAAAEHTKKLAGTARSANADILSLLDRVVGLESRHEIKRSTLQTLTGEIDGQLDRIESANATLTRVTSGISANGTEQTSLGGLTDEVRKKLDEYKKSKEKK